MNTFKRLKMLIINRISKILTEDQEMQILELIAENASDISMNVFDKNSGMFPYLQMREIIRTRLYLSRLGDAEPRATYLLTTTSAHNQTIGYILYHKAVGEPSDISIISTIVSSQFRNQGILKSMMNILKTEFNTISLSCFVDKVSIYQKLGFEIACQNQTQIGMYYGKMEDGQVVTVDDEQVNNIDVVIKAFEDVKINSGAEWTKIYNQLNDNNRNAILLAELFIKNSN